MRSTLIIALLSSVAVLAGEALAADNTADNTKADTSSTSANADTSSASAKNESQRASRDAESERFGMLYTLASQMIGHAAMARDAIAFGLYTEAADNINAAQKEAADLTDQTPKFNEQFAHKTAAKNTQSANAEYLFPVMDNTLYMQDINAKAINSSNPKVDVADAEKVNYLLFINTKQASDALDKAQGDAKQGKYDDAMVALNNISNGAVIEASAYDTPLEAARDNLLLGREMIHDKQYKSASYAIKHAKFELSRAEKEDPKLANSRDTRDMQTQIADMQDTLAKDNPPPMQSAEAKIDGWIHSIESHMHKNG